MPAPIQHEIYSVGSSFVRAAVKKEAWEGLRFWHWFSAGKFEHVGEDIFESSTRKGVFMHRDFLNENQELNFFQRTWAGIRHALSFFKGPETVQAAESGDKGIIAAVKKLLTGQADTAAAPAAANTVDNTANAATKAAEVIANEIQEKAGVAAMRQELRDAQQALRQAIADKKPQAELDALRQSVNVANAKLSPIDTQLKSFLASKPTQTSHLVTGDLLSQAHKALTEANTEFTQVTQALRNTKFENYTPDQMTAYLEAIAKRDSAFEHLQSLVNLSAQQPAVSSLVATHKANADALNKLIENAYKGTIQLDKNNPIHAKALDYLKQQAETLRNSNRNKDANTLETLISQLEGGSARLTDKNTHHKQVVSILTDDHKAFSAQGAHLEALLGEDQLLAKQITPIRQNVATLKATIKTLEALEAKGQLNAGQKLTLADAKTKLPEKEAQLAKFDAWLTQRAQEAKTQNHLNTLTGQLEADIKAVTNDDALKAALETQLKEAQEQHQAIQDALLARGKGAAEAASSQKMLVQRQAQLKAAQPNQVTFFSDEVRKYQEAVAAYRQQQLENLGVTAYPEKTGKKF